jgi:hypothetical protein
MVALVSRGQAGILVESGEGGIMKPRTYDRWLGIIEARWRDSADLRRYLWWCWQQDWPWLVALAIAVETLTITAVMVARVG